MVSRIAELTKEEDKYWQKVFSQAMNEGVSEMNADKQAFQETKKKFPRLKKFDRFI